ncbi:hypothetical protein FBQ82_00600 [Anaerolineae bacterium CFX7]|nr:hypothetical protein [Anaerolineae bacterium CFX7]
MAIKRISVYPNDPDKDIFEIAPRFQVFEEQTAIALDHLLDHIYFLEQVGELGIYSASVAARLAEFPQYGILDEEDTPDNRIARVLEDECVILLKYFARICEASRLQPFQPTPEQRAETEGIRARLVSEMRERVPLLNADSL